MDRIAALFFTLLSASLAVAQPSSSDIKLESIQDYLQQAFLAGEARDREAFFHIGIEGKETDQGYLVTAVLEDYPAFFAGINRGDVIVQANGAAFHPINSFNVSDSESKTYELSLMRGEAAIQRSVTPVYENLFDSYRSATLNSIQEFSAGNKVIGYIRLWALSRGTSDLITYKALMSGFNHCDGLIIDLRNSQGYLDRSHLEALTPNLKGAEYFGKSVVIIIDSSTSAEAIELARAVKDLDRFVVLGEANENGLQPEIEALYPFDEVTRGDPQFETALNRLLGTI